MAKDKKSVLLYCDIIHTVEELDDADAGLLFKHYLRYVNDLNPEPPSKLIKIVFEPIKQNLKRDLKKWEKKSERNSEIAKAYWDKRKDANASERIKADSKNADKDIVIVTDTVKDIVKESVKGDSLTQWFLDLINSSYLENIAIAHKVTKESLLSRVEEFKKHCEVSYPTYIKFVYHFKSWLNKNKSILVKKRNALV